MNCKETLIHESNFFKSLKSVWFYLSKNDFIFVINYIWRKMTFNWIAKMLLKDFYKLKLPFSISLDKNPHFGMSEDEIHRLFGVSETKKKNLVCKHVDSRRKCIQLCKRNSSKSIKTELSKLWKHGNGENKY